MSEFLARGAMGQILEGQTAIVTGAGSADGIGFAIARRLLRDGAQIAITSTTERIHERARELDASGKNVVAAVGGLSQGSGGGRVLGKGGGREGRGGWVWEKTGVGRGGGAGEGGRSRRGV